MRRRYIYAIHGDGEIFVLWQCASLHGRVLSAVLFIVSLRSAESASGGWMSTGSVAPWIMPGMENHWSKGVQAGKWRNEREDRVVEGRSFIVANGERRKGRLLRTRRYDFSFNNHGRTIPPRQKWCSPRVQREYLHNPLEINRIRTVWTSPSSVPLRSLGSLPDDTLFFLPCRSSSLHSIIFFQSRVPLFLLTRSCCETFNDHRSYRNAPPPHREKLSLRLNDFPGETPWLTIA